MRSWLGGWLRRWADRVDWRGAPRCLTALSFTYETGEGIRFREDGRGCRLWVLGYDDYDKAHTEADSAVEDALDADRRSLLDRPGHREDARVSLEALVRFRNDNMAARLDSWRTDTAVYVAGPMGPAAQAEYERRESRGWN